MLRSIAWLVAPTIDGKSIAPLERTRDAVTLGRGYWRARAKPVPSAPTETA